MYNIYIYNVPVSESPGTLICTSICIAGCYLPLQPDLKLLLQSWFTMVYPCGQFVTFQTKIRDKLFLG